MCTLLHRRLLPPILCLYSRILILYFSSNVLETYVVPVMPLWSSWTPNLEEKIQKICIVGACLNHRGGPLHWVPHVLYGVIVLFCGFSLCSQAPGKKIHERVNEGGGTCCRGGGGGYNDAHNKISKRPFFRTCRT